jgi:hypothetical protein
MFNFIVIVHLAAILYSGQKKCPSLGGKEEAEKYLKEYKLTKTEDWYFRFGKRCVLSGYPDEIDFIEDLRDYVQFGFKYPIED